MTYQASVAAGSPISARQLAARHGISRRQAGQVVATVTHEANGQD
jgi:DNA-binding IscR family transcriptional regulator